LRYCTACPCKLEICKSGSKTYITTAIRVLSRSHGLQHKLDTFVPAKLLFYSYLCLCVDLCYWVSIFPMLLQYRGCVWITLSRESARGGPLSCTPQPYEHKRKNNPPRASWRRRSISEESLVLHIGRLTHIDEFFDYCCLI
jgi:hypothetical protein